MATEFRKRGAPYKTPCGKVLVHPELRIYRAKHGRRQCNHCGQWYSITRDTKKYCSEACTKRAAYDARPYYRPLVQDVPHYSWDTCVTCRKTFPRRALNQTTCSHVCRETLNYRIRKLKLKYPNIQPRKDIAVKRHKELDGHAGYVNAAYLVHVAGKPMGSVTSFDGGTARATALIVYAALVEPLGKDRARSWAASLVHPAIPWLTIGKALDLET